MAVNLPTPGEKPWGDELNTRWDGLLSANFASHTSKYAATMLGVFVKGPGGSPTYAKPTDCKTGLWTPA